MSEERLRARARGIDFGNDTHTRRQKHAASTTDAASASVMGTCTNIQIARFDLNFDSHSLTTIRSDYRKIRFKYTRFDFGFRFEVRRDSA